jgi:DNA repair protein SbcD/Mre11
MKILHAADLHIDSPMRGIERYEGAPVETMRSSTRRAAENLVDLALRERVDVVTIGGDVFDGAWPDINTGLWWRQQLVRLVDAGIEVYVVLGNHDAQSVITKQLAPPTGVHVFSTEAPESKRSTNLPLVVHGQSYRDRAMAENLAAAYPNAVPGLVNVGLLHTSLDGREGHATYAPCTVESLVSKGYAFWGLGHVHQRERLDPAGTLLLFPGNTQGRSVRETGAKGVSIVTTDDTSVLAERFVEVDVVRWARLPVDVTGLQGEDDLQAQVLDAVEVERRRAGRPLVVRIDLSGTGPLHRRLRDRLEVIRANLAGRLKDAEGDVWLEKLIDGTREERVVGAAETAAVTGVRNALAEALESDAVARSLLGVLPAVDAKFAGVLGRLDADDVPASLTDLEYVRARLPRAAELLIARLEER